MRGLRSFARALVAHTFFVLLGFVFATWLAVPGLVGAAVAVWGFGLVLSLRTLACGGSEPALATDDDAFEAARARALALLDEEP